MGNSLYVSPGHQIFRHAERYLGQEIGMELALAVYRDDIRVLDFEDYSEYCTLNNINVKAVNSKDCFINSTLDNANLVQTCCNWYPDCRYRSKCHSFWRVK